MMTDAALSAVGQWPDASEVVPVAPSEPAGPRIRHLSRTEKVAERIARQILDDVVDNDMKPGDLLPSESRMLEQYGVGRASLREALRLLEVYGAIWVKAGPRGGPVVGSPEVSDFGRSASLHFQLRHGTMRQVIEARLTLEPMMARMAAERIDSDGIEALMSQVSNGREALTQTSTWGATSADFHELVGLLAGNVMLELFSNSLSAIQNARIVPIFPQDERGEVVKVHEMIARAIIAGKASRAESLMRSHLEALYERITVSLPGILDEIIRWR